LFGGGPQGGAGADDALLADELVESARAHACGERSARRQRLVAALRAGRRDFEQARFVWHRS
jgi:hypothetical protein